MARNEAQEPRSRSNSLSAAWSYLWRGSKQQHPTLHNQLDPGDNTSSRSTKPLTIQEEEDDDEDRALGKGIARKVLPQQRRPTSSVQSSPFSNSKSTPMIEPSRVSLSQEQQRPQQQHQPSALERIAIHNGNINNALAATMQHSMSLPPMNRVDDMKDAIHEGTLAPAVEDGRSQYHSRLRHQQPQQRSGHGRKLSVPEGIFAPEERATSAAAASTTSTTRSEGQHKMFTSRDGCGSESADSTAHSTTTGAHRSSSPASCCSLSSSSCPSPPSDKDIIPGIPTKTAAPLKSDIALSSSSSLSSSPPQVVGLGLLGIHGPETPDLLSQFVTPVSGPSYFEITPSSAQVNEIPSTPKKSSFGTKTPGRRSKRTSAHGISSTITNGGIPSSRRVSCAETGSQNSASYIDEQDVELDENSFYIHLQKMQERYQTQQEPGWLRTQHALLQAKHRIPGSGSPQSDYKNSFGGRKSGPIPGAQPFLSRIHSSSSSPNSSDYSSSPSFHLGPQHARQAYSGASSSQRHQTIQPYNCFQPGNVICVPRERSLGGLIFHKTFVDTHILKPSPYYQGQYLTLDNKVVEIDKDYVREISGFVHPRSVQILSEETVYNGSSKKPTRVLVLERPLEGDGVVLSRLYDGPALPSLRQYSNDLAFLESLPELSRALRDFNNLCQEFENTYIYIRGFAAHTLEKLRLIYEKTHRDCIGDSVKLQKMLNRGIQFEQDTFAELMENVVLGKLYQKLFIHSLVPCYAQRDVEIDAIIEKYHRYLFAPGAHRGIDGSECLAATDGPVLRDTLKKLGLSEKWRTMNFDHVLEGAAGLFRAWDQESHDGPSGQFSSSSGQTRAAMGHFQETDQERKRRQLRESLRIFVQDDKYKSGMRAAANGVESRREEAERPTEDEDEDDPTASAVWNTPLEKTSCIKLVMDTIAVVAEDHLMNGQCFGFVQKKRSEVSVTTDDFIPLLAIVIIQARMMSLGSNLFYMQRFRINAPKSDLNFALVTFEASVEFLKTDPLGLLDTEQTPPLRPSSTSISPVSRNSMQGSQLRTEVDQRSSIEEVQGLPWGTPSHTGWGFSPPKISASDATFAQSTPSSEKNLFMTPMEYSPSRPPPSSRMSSDYSQQQYQQQYQQRHARSTSMNFDDRFRRVAQGEDSVGGSSNNSSWSRSPMLGPRFISGTSSPLGATPSSYGVLPSSSEASSGSFPRRPSYQLQQMPQRHSISSGQGLLYTHAQQNHHLHRISVEQGRETMSRSTILPLQSPNMTPQLVVKPQIMLPPPKTPPMSGQNTSGRGRPMSMVVVGALASSAYSSSYGGSGSSNARKSFSSNHSSPATSPRLGPGLGTRPSSSRSNSLMSGPFPMLRANSTNTIITANELSRANGTRASVGEREQGEPLSPLSPMSPWVSKLTPQSPLQPSSLLLNELSVATDVLAPQTPEAPKQQNNRIPGRIRTSPSSTVSSISTPTTPSTFSSASANALLDSLNANSQLSSPPPGPPSSLKATHPLDSVTPNSSSAPSSAAGIIRSQSSGDRQSSIRLSLPRLSLSPSAPSTAFCKTTVTAAATHATTSVDYLEPTSTVLATDLYGPGMNATATAILATSSLATVQSERNSIGSRPREAVGSGAGTHQKVDSGKYVGHYLGGHSHKNTSTSSNSSTTSNTSSSGNGNVGGGPNSTKRYSNSTLEDHYSHGARLDLGHSFHEELFLDAQQPIPDRRRGSAISLKSAKSVGSFQPEKTILVWNQHHTGSIIDGPGIHGSHGSHGAGPVGSRINRLTVSNGDLPSASSPAGSMMSYSRPHTPMATSFVIEDMQQQKRTREMMGDFLSELAKVEDGDVLVGNGRDGVMSRQ